MSFDWIYTGAKLPNLLEALLIAVLVRALLQSSDNCCCLQVERKMANRQFSTRAEHIFILNYIHYM